MEALNKQITKKIEKAKFENSEKNHIFGELVEEKLLNIEKHIHQDIERRLNDLSIADMKLKNGQDPNFGIQNMGNIESLREEFNMKMGSLINEMSNMVTLEDFDSKIKALESYFSNTQDPNNTNIKTRNGENPNFSFSKKI